MKKYRQKTIRKLQKTNKNQWIITLPKDWIKFLNAKQKEEFEWILINKDELQLKRVNAPRQTRG